MERQLASVRIHSPTVHIASVLYNCFPELKLKRPERRKYAQFPGYWKQLKHQRLFLDNLAKKLNIKDPKDWYFVSTRQVHALGGHGLLNYYKGSLIQALQANYHGHWSTWRFSSPHNAVKGKAKFSKTQHVLFQQVTEVSTYHVEHDQ